MPKMRLAWQMSPDAPPSDIARQHGRATLLAEERETV
jgi:hypothetical protein